MDIIIKIAQLLLSLTILVALHELGHFLAAKAFKTRVEKFYIFFNPWFSLFKKKVGETTYGIGWLPLGGYVKISGMIDESMDKEQLKKAPEPWEFRSKPRWQKLIIMLAGVFVNVVLAFFIYSMVLWVWGKGVVYNSVVNKNGGIEVLYYGCMDATHNSFNKNANMPIPCDELDGEKTPPSFSLKTGDKILKIDGENVENKSWKEIRLDLLLWGEKPVLVDRGGKKTRVLIKGSDIQLMIARMVEIKPLASLITKKIYTEKDIPRTVLSKENLKKVDESLLIAQKAGLLENKKIIRVESVGGNGEDIRCVSDFKSALNKFRGKKIKIFYTPVDSTLVGFTDFFTVPNGYNPKIGFEYDLEYGFKPVDIKYSLFGGENPSFITAGIKETKKEISNYLGQLALLFAPETEVYKEVGGFIKIGQIFPDSSGFSWEFFWRITAILSIMLAVINLLPIPALDGGHAAILLFEMITGKDLSPRVLEKLQIIGMIILLALFVYANGLDIWNLFT